MGRFIKRIYFYRESVLQIHLYIEDGGSNMEHYVIYKYIKIDENEVVYVGRTNNLERRRREHEIYEPTEVNRPHYNYPLSRGIRKYGVNAYKCEIIEEVSTYEESLEQEKYWIKYYDTFNDPSKYNYTPGGELSFTTTKFEDEIIEEVKELLEQQIDYETIRDRTGVSISHISEINTGKRRKDKNRTYPINEMTRGRKISSKELQEIIELLKTTQITCAEIGKKYNVSGSAIQRINNGSVQRQSDIDYPIRKRVVPHKKHTLTTVELGELYNDIINTNIPFNQLAVKYNISVTTVYNINKGNSRKNNNYSYPLRK